ncbi:MAG: DUF3086 domain-containing protein [Cyanobacteriota bacterium]
MSEIGDGPAVPWQELDLTGLTQRREELTAEIGSLEQRRDQLQQEIDRHFVGQADGLSRRVRGFQDYLVGALQELARSAEQLPLVPEPVTLQPSPLDQPAAATAPAASSDGGGPFSADADLIRGRLKGWREAPDFYAEPWRLRRSLDGDTEALLQDWFLSQGGRGAQPSGGSRGRNVLAAAAAISLLGDLYGDRFQTLVLASEPERLGEWRRGLQDSLGLSREDFGPGSGVVLFEQPGPLVERADRLEERGDLPFIVVDASERSVAIPILQFPLWLVFAADPRELRDEEDLL